MHEENTEKHEQYDHDLGKVIFCIHESDVQEEALRIIGRHLTEDELYYARKGIEAGLSFDIETVFATAIDDSVALASKE